MGTQIYGWLVRSTSDNHRLATATCEMASAGGVFVNSGLVGHLVGDQRAGEPVSVGKAPCLPGRKVLSLPWFLFHSIGRQALASCQCEVLSVTYSLSGASPLVWSPMGRRVEPPPPRDLDLPRLLPLKPSSNLQNRSPPSSGRRTSALSQSDSWEHAEVRVPLRELCLVIGDAL